MKNKQRIAIEKITGEDADRWHPEAVTAFFAFTDRGERVKVEEEAREDLNALLFAHKFHPVSVEMWKEDFKSGLLSLEDFIDQGYPDSYVEHAFEIYTQVKGIPPLKPRMINIKTSKDYHEVTIR